MTETIQGVHMKRVFTLSAAFVLTASAAFAQAPAAPPQKISLATGLQRSYNGIKMNLTEMSTKMPEADYTFQPTKDVRTFGQLLGHATNAQFNACSVAKGEANPNQGKDAEKLATKAESVKALADSFAYCDGVFAALTDASAMEFVKQGQNEVMRAVPLANLVAHSNEIYGTAVPYMRLKGLVPPSTERATAARRPGQ
jgi:hypothetical protein